MASNIALTESDVRKAYSKLRELVKETLPLGAERAEIEAQVRILDDFMRQNAHTKFKGNELEGYAEMALAEGHVELFEKVCDWCKLGSVRDESELGQWRLCYIRLYRTINYYCGTSVKLATRLAHSSHYIRAVELRLRSNLNDEQTLILTLQLNLHHLNITPIAIKSFRELYQLILKIYNNSKMNEELRVLASMILSLLSTEKEAKDLNESVISLLITFLWKSVRNELPLENKTKWNQSRRVMIILTLEKVIASDESIIVTLLKLDLLTLLEQALNSPIEGPIETQAILTLLWSLSQDDKALNCMARDTSLLKLIEQCSTSHDSKQAKLSKEILESIKGQVERVNAEHENNAQNRAHRRSLPPPPPLPPQYSLSTKHTPNLPQTPPPNRLQQDNKRQSSGTINNATANSYSTPPQSPNEKHLVNTATTEAVALNSSIVVINTSSGQQNIATAQRVARVGDKSTPVFISYQSAFTERVLKLKQALEARGIPCWMATEDMVGNVQDAVGEVLMVAPAIVICYSHTYRESIYCKIEANTAIRWNIPMVACRVEEGYQADYWLGVITSAAPGLDCSTDAKLTTCLDRLEKELRAARRIIKPKVPVGSLPSYGKAEERVLNTSTSAHTEGTSATKIHNSSPLLSNTGADQRKQSFAEWDVNHAAQWLKKLSIYESIPHENRGLIDGAFLKEMRLMKHDMPTEFVKSLEEIFHFNAATSVKFRAELEKLE